MLCLICNDGIEIKPLGFGTILSILSRLDNKNYDLFGIK
jgi:hypothetical protein